MSKVLENYRGGQGDCYQDGCEECQVMLIVGYEKSGCPYHKSEKRCDRYKTALEEIRDSQEPWEPQRTIALEALDE